MTVANVLELVARMRRDAFSRNRNFDAFERADAEAVRARRLWRYLRSLEQDLMSFRSSGSGGTGASGTGNGGMGVKIVLEPHGEGGRRITFSVPDIRMSRMAILSAEEYQLLREHPDARAVLDTVEGNRL
jgi:hypothetical protein